MAISKNSVRVQFTINTDKEKEKIIADFLAGYVNPKNAIKEILYNYIVSNCGAKSPQATQIEVIQSNPELPKVSKSDDIMLDINNIATQSEEKLPEVSELELNELEELNKFITGN